MIKRPVVAIVALVVLGGCSSSGETTTTATARATTTTTTTTSEPTATQTGLGPLTAEELAWLSAVGKIRVKIDKAFGATSARLTRSKMVSIGKALSGCSRDLRRIGVPTERLQPVYALVKSACQKFDKGAKCFATAASVSDKSGAVVAGTAAERTQTKAIDCAFAGQGDGSKLLAEAEVEAKSQEIKAEFG
jgi:hypothetical protein